MSATDELRRLLDERGVEWGTQIGIESHYKTMWRSGSWEYTAIETSGGEFSVYVEHRGWLTPEQAIAATLGNDGVGRSNDEVEMLQNELYDYEKMYSHICDQLARVKGHLAEAGAENDKLRTLAGALFDCSRDGLYTDELPCQWCDLKSKEVCERMAKELGVIE